MLVTITATGCSLVTSAFTAILAAAVLPNANAGYIETFSV